MIRVEVVVPLFPVILLEEQEILCPSKSAPVTLVEFLQLIPVIVGLGVRSIGQMCQVLPHASEYGHFHKSCSVRIIREKEMSCNIIELRFPYIFHILGISSFSCYSV